MQQSIAGRMDQAEELICEIETRTFDGAHGWLSWLDIQLLM